MMWILLWSAWEHRQIMAMSMTATQGGSSGELSDQIYCLLFFLLGHPFLYYDVQGAFVLIRLVSFYHQIF